MPTVDTAADASRTSSIESEGMYHMQVTEFDCDPHDREGNMIVGAWMLKATVLDGTARTPDGKGCVYRGSAQTIRIATDYKTDKDGGDFRERVLTRWLLVLRLIDESQIGGAVDFDEKAAVGRQFVAKFSKSEHNGKTHYRADGLDFFTVDSPHVAAVPKDEAAIAAISKELRGDVADSRNTAYSEPAQTPAIQPAAQPAAQPAPQQPVAPRSFADEI